MGYFKQEHWNELSCPPPGNLPDPGMKPIYLMSPELQTDYLPMTHQEGPTKSRATCYNKTDESHEYHVE